MRLWMIVAIASAVGCAAPAPLPPSTSSISLGMAGRDNSGPAVAAVGDVVAVAWAARTDDGGTDIYASISRDAGATFGSAVRVSGQDHTAAVSGEQPPRVGVVPHSTMPPSIVVLWSAKREGRTVLVVARSDDGGATFGAPNVVPGTDAAGNRGWEALAIDRQGRASAIWLDHRETADAGSAMHHDGHDHHAPDAADSVARAQRSKLYFERLEPSGTATPLFGGVCYCCKTSLAAGPDGALYAAWRHVYTGNVRDIAFASSRDQGRTFTAPVRVSDDRWVLDGCPENGPAVAADERNRIHIVWPTISHTAGNGDALALYYAWSDDGGSFSPKQMLPTEWTPRHPQLAVMPDGRPVAVWDEGANGAREIALAVGEAGTERRATFRRVEITAQDRLRSGYPVVATTGGVAIVAWEEGPAAGRLIRVVRLSL